MARTKAGLGPGARLTDYLGASLMARVVPPEIVHEVLDAHGRNSQRIRHSDYLAKAYRSFSEITGALFIYGHSLAENDEHYLKRIEKGKVTQLYIGLHGSPDSPSNKRIVRRADQMTTNRRRGAPLSISYFDSSTARVWGK